MGAPVITYQRGYRFDLAPDRLWDRIEEVDQFERWWPWLTEFRIEGDGLSAGSVLHGVVTPPLPYRMRLRVELVDCDRPHAIDATIGGDLIGEARLRLHPAAGGTLAEVSWQVEMCQPAMRLASRIGRPLLQWGHDRVVEMTVAGFRRRIASV
ncbi:MAG TPA: SRPBCC family protein [Acidimicrobiales bacterium]|nr:SRPBCC family protein [Acidimicrobiales bacterium]